MKKRLVSLIMAAVLGSLLGRTALANPTGAAVVNGRVVLSNAVPGTLEITNSPGAIVNWRQFSIGNGETTRFLQESAASAILNRVTGGDPSAIAGRLLSNGRVFLINRNGIVFGPGAVVDTAGLVASTLDISDEDFIAQNLRFQGDAASGSIENQGYIKAGADGSIFLIAPHITNGGVIETDGGRLVLAAGQSVSLVSLDSDNIVFDVQAPDDAVVNLGELLTRGGAAAMFAGTIEHRGSVNADSVSRDAQGRVQLRATSAVDVTAGAVLSANGDTGGSVVIDAGAGRAEVSGSVSARGDAGTGGSVEMYGDTVALRAAASVDATGASGGGAVRIGGEFRGAGPRVDNARRTAVAAGATINADARDRGDGGSVVVWSDEQTMFAGRISARGGADGGDGGLAEVSGKRYLDFSGRVDLLAPAGKSGTLLLDPKNITVTAGIGAAATSLLFTDTPGTDSVLTNDAVNAALALGNLTLEANNNFLLEAGADINVTAPGVRGDLVIRAGGSATFNADIITDGGDLLVFANNALAVDSEREPGAAAIVMADGTTFNTGTGNISLEIGTGPPTNNTSGNIDIANLSAAHIDLTLNGASAGSSIRRVSGTSLINASSLFIDHDPFGGPGGGSVGTAAEPLRIAVSNVAAHTHLASPGIFLDSVSTSTTTVGDTLFGDLHGIRGLETVAGGDIVVNAVAGLKVLQDIRVNSGSLTLNAGTTLAGDLEFDAEAAFADADSDSTIEVFVGSGAASTGDATLSGDNIRFLGANSDTSRIDLRVRGAGDLAVTAGGDLVARAGTGGGVLDTINIVSGDLSSGTGSGGAMTLTATGGEIRIESPAGAQQIQALVQANNGKQTLSAGSDITLDAGPQANSAVTVEAAGAVVSGLQQEVLLNADAGAGEGTLLMKAGGGLNNLVRLVAAGGEQRIDAKGAASGIVMQTDGSTGTGKVEITALANQTIASAGSGDIAVLAGAIPVQILTSGGTQSITTGGGLRVLGGAAAAGDAFVQAQTGQTIAALFVDAIGSAGDAIIDSNGGLQKIDTTGKNTAGVNEGVLVDASGSGVAAIHSDGTQSLGVVDSDLLRVIGRVGNADISSTGTQTISVTGSGANAIEVGDVVSGATSGSSLIAGNQTIVAGTGAESGSIRLRAGTTDAADSRLTSTAGQTISTTGNLTLTGGAGGSADADIDAPTGLLDLNVGGDLLLTGGSGSSSQAEINVGTLTLVVGGDMSLLAGSTTNTDSSVFTAGDNSTSVGGALTLSGGPVSSDVEINSGGNIVISTGAGMTLTGGSGDGAEAILLADTLLDLTIGGDLILTGGTAPNTDANIESNDGNFVADVTGAVTLTGSTGTDADVKLRGTRGFDLTVGTNLSVAGGGASGVFGFLGVTTSDIASFASPTTVTVGGDMLLTGGSQDGTDVDVQGATINLDVGGNLQLIGGSGSGASVEIDDATSIDIDVGGALSLTGGSSTDTAALIGDRDADATVTIGKTAPVGGTITLTGGTHAQGRAAIGTTCAPGPCAANVTVNGAGLVNFSTPSLGPVLVGSLDGASGSVAIKAGLSGPGDLLLGRSTVQVDGPLTLEALAGRISSSFNALVDAGSGALTATSLNTLGLPQLAAGTLVLRSNAGDVDITTTTTVQARATGLGAGTPAIDIQAPAGDVDLYLEGKPTIAMATTSGGIRMDAAGTIELDSGDDDTLYMTPGDLSLTAGADIEAEASAEFDAANITISAGGRVDTGEDVTASGAVSIQALGGRVDLDNIVAALDIAVTGSDTVDIAGASTTGGIVTVTSTAGDVMFQDSAGVLRSDRTGLAPGTFAIDVQALGAGRRIQNDANFLTSASGGIRLRADAEVDVHRVSGGRRSINAAGDVVVEARNGPIDVSFGVAADIVGRSVTLSALNGIDTRGDITTTGGDARLNITSGTIDLTRPLNTSAGLVIDAAGGDFNMTAPGQVTAGGDIAISGKDLFLNATGLTDLTSPTRVTLNASGQVTNFGATGGIPDIDAPLLDITANNGVELDIDADTLTLANALAGSVVIIDTAGTLDAASVTNPGRPVTLTTQAGPLAIGVVNGSTVTLSPATLGGTRAITDSNGASLNITATTLGFSAPAGFGTFADPIETSVATPFAVDTSTGDIGIVQSGNLSLPADLLTSGDIRLGASGGELLLQDRTVKSSAGRVRLSGSTVRVQAVAAPTLVDAATALDVVDTGSLVVQGSNTTASATAKLRGVSSVDINAGNVSVIGGDANFATAIIDPVLVLGTLSMTLGGNLELAGGAGLMSEARLSAGSITLNVAGNTSLSGGAGSDAFAVIDAIGGNVTLTAGTGFVPGTVSLVAGSGPNADAIITASSGLGLVAISAGTCSNCDVLALDPFLDPAAQQGIFGGFGFTALEALPSTGLPDGTDAIIVLDDYGFIALLILPGSEDEGEDDRGRRVLMCR